MESSEEGTKTSERVPTPNVGKESIVGNGKFAAEDVHVN
jgi:hypothetical protein